MITFPGPNPSIELCIPARSEAFSVEDLECVAQGIEAEDMRPVTVSDLARSYSATAAYDISCPEKKRIVGFARLVQRDRLAMSIGGICSVEIGSVWVDSAYRGQKIGPALIKHTTNLMQAVGFVPLAVCNQYSRKTFEALGYRPIGHMPSPDGHHDRIVEMYENPSDLYIQRRWQSLRPELLACISGLQRFQEMKLLDQEPVQAAMQYS